MPRTHPCDGLSHILIYGFEWVSNLQVICVVHLKPAQGKNRKFTLPAADKKTVTEAMKKMLLP